MREYRANKRELGITTNKTRGIASSVIPDSLVNTADVQSNIPVYDATKHRAGDRVLVSKGNRLVETVIPTLDGDGNPIYEE